jgi:threonine dehydrogenase-like Zn-dependent dehydrogenase
VGVAIEALGIQTTLENALRALKPGGVLSSVGVYSGHLRILLDAFGAGLADQLLSRRCALGAKSECALIRLVEAGRINLKQLLVASGAVSLSSQPDFPEPLSCRKLNAGEMA